MFLIQKLSKLLVVDYYLDADRARIITDVDNESARRTRLGGIKSVWEHKVDYLAEQLVAHGVSETPAQIIALTQERFP